MAEEPGEFTQNAAGAVGGLDLAPAESEDRAGLAFEGEFSGAFPTAAGGSERVFEALVFLGQT